jgi:hypothetical protein
MADVVEIGGADEVGGGAEEAGGGPEATGGAQKWLDRSLTSLIPG